MHEAELAALHAEADSGALESDDIRSPRMFLKNAQPGNSAPNSEMNSQCPCR